ncbi:MAG: ASPIC/UnbV domain-containing protein [Bacteroidota bacterium]
MGSRVEVKLNDRTLIREIDGGSSHLSQNSTIAHFGIGDHEVVESVTVKWLGGKSQTIDNVAANQVIKIIETDQPLVEFPENTIKVFPGFFEDRIVLEYKLEEPGPITLSVFDAQGRLIRELTEIEAPARTGIWQWNIDQELIRGMYIFQLRTKNQVVGARAIKL